MKIIHQRFSRDRMVFSKLTLPWLNNQPNIHGGEPLKCIPAGIYNCIPYFSPKRQEDCWLLENVPGFTYIEIHAGNYGRQVGQNKPDTEGCLMYGFGYNPYVPMLLQSQRAILWLRTTIGLKSNFEIDIRD